MPPDVQGFGRSLLHAAQAMLVSGFGAACLLNSDSPLKRLSHFLDYSRALGELRVFSGGQYFQRPFDTTLEE